jgi:Galactose oxidase, central domain
MPSFFWTQKQNIGPSSRTSHGLTYDGERKRAVLFGGDPGGPPLADTWSWDGALWTQVADTGPSARHGLAIAFDSAAKRVFLFGGASGSDLLADTWIWDGTEWTQVADTGPAARSGHALAYDDPRKRVVLFGGRSAANPLGDTWEWDGTEWTQVQDVGPSARRAHAMAFDPTGARVVLFGGAGANGAGLNDTWLWDGAAWTQTADTGPDPRAACAMVSAKNIVLFGGVNSLDPGFPPANRIIYGDSWRWDGTAWTKVQDIGPAPRWGHGMAYWKSDAAAGRIVLVGGSSVFGPPQDASLQAGVMRDTWEAPVEGVASGPVTLQSLTINPATVVGPITANGIIRLSSPAPAGGATVQLTKTSSRTPDTSVFVSGSQVTIPANSDSGSFGIQGGNVFAGHFSVVVTATLGGSSVSATATFYP